MSHTFTDIEEGSIVSSHQLDENFKYLDDRITTTNTTVTENSTSISSLQSTVSSLSSQSIVTPTAVSITGGVKFTLTDNKAHKVQIPNKTTFVLPTVTDTSKLHQMLVLLYMPTAYTINFGTNSKYFGGYAPDMSRTGYYTVIFEYDGYKWEVGVIYKGT